MATNEENQHQQRRTEDIQQLIGHQEEVSPQQLIIKDEEEDSWLSHEEEEDGQSPYIKVEVLEADVSKFPRTGETVKSEKDDGDPPERSWRHHVTTETDGDGPVGAPPDSLLAPLSDSDDIQVTSDSDSECWKTDPTFNSKQSCHLKRSKAKRFRCTVCSQRFLREKHLTRHTRTHTGEILRCSACFKGFLHKHALIKHTLMHSEARAARCSVWGKGFIQKPNAATPVLTSDPALLTNDPVNNHIVSDDPRVRSPAVLDWVNSHQTNAECSAATSLAHCERSQSESDNSGGALAPSTSPTQVKMIKRSVRLTVEQKKEIIAEHESGVRVCDLATQFGLAKSTVCTILKNKASIKAADVAKGVTLLTKQRPQILEEVEKLLLLWVNVKELAGDGVRAAAVIEKAKQLHSDLVAGAQSASRVQCDKFKASRGWFDNFIKRSGIRSIRHDQDVAGLNQKAAEKFAAQFERFVTSEGYLPNQVFSLGQAGLFWRKMPRRTSLTKEEKARPGHKPMKDKLTLLLCANASGDCQLKPLLVYHSENPRAFKSNRVVKAELPVMWRANPKIRVTRLFFTEWVTQVFAPAVKTYLEENALPLKCLLVLDKAPAHPPSLEEDLDIEYNFIKVQSLPSNTTLLLQPMGQEVATHFRKLYTKALFSRCFQVTKGTDLALTNFWRDHFNIFHCIHIIDEVWREISHRTLQSAWKKLWPSYAEGRGLDGLDFEEEAVVDEIVSIGRSMGLEVDRQDVEELVEEQMEDHHKELTTEELLELQREQIKSY
ncbi:tigger transposable element-derived protein 1-like [Syngnathus acus]|uniref:tigger transposable element-derived protein 1-like n=1 Tax=Syngnathus acus TaxID=161584 RepID=UPI001886353C|nr:tigger transposable element-derived protein 1-like [Syngnathus acus]